MINEFEQVHWIKSGSVELGRCPVFIKKFQKSKCVSAVLSITAKGVYYPEINGKRIGDFIMAPGWTQYEKRLQYQTYDVTELLQDGENTLAITVAAGWYAGRINYWYQPEINKEDLKREGGYWNISWNASIIARLVLTYDNGEKEIIGTDDSWLVGEGPLLFSELWDGEIFDARKGYGSFSSVIVDTEDKRNTLLEQEGEAVVEQERISSSRIFTTPKGEKVIDFGQNLTGYPEVSLVARAGETLSISFAETLDKDGNFYNDNYRSARCEYKYICRDGAQTFKPRCTFYGFRYIRIDEFPASAQLTEETFTAIAVYSRLKQTGNIVSSEFKLNQLFSNVLWGQRSNFLDVPTDCPQRDERFGWTGDAQVFCKAASYNFDVETFFRKWLRDMDAFRQLHGAVGFTIPRSWDSPIAAGWSDAAVIVPWQIYLTYGDKAFLAEMIEMMRSHVDMIGRESEKENTWYGGKRLHQFGDWLATDLEDAIVDDSFKPDAYSGATRPNFLQAAFYAYDTRIVADALQVLGKDNTHYRELFERIKNQFQKDFPVYNTQTECVLALRFGLTSNINETVKLLVKKIENNGYRLLLQEEYPSWLYSVNLGATTMWEHWDSINVKGEMWDIAMNSFNHYAYGSVVDWIYEIAGGIRQENESAGFSEIVVQPHPNKRLRYLETSFDSKKGKIISKWIYTLDGNIRYEITVPAKAKILIGGKENIVEKGTYIFIEKVV